MTGGIWDRCLGSYAEEGDEQGPKYSRLSHRVSCFDTFISPYCKEFLSA
jgi:hypothetical protein